MSKTIRAVFTAGVIRPTEPLDLPDPCEVEVEVHAAQPAAGPCRFWREIRGSVSFPLSGEDAQGWVSRGRCEADEHRHRRERGDA
jgi:predicted DNA-binding antitoxin AbrB/MazE fold protein